MPALSLSYPRKSHRKTVSLPERNIKLAELIGIIYGDGSIGNLWQVVISLNSVSDKIYADYVSNLFKDLFRVAAPIRKRPNQNTLVVVCSSTSIVEYLVQHGAVRGSKLADKLNIPSWIKENEVFEKAFVRGLVDTDGCIFLHRHFTKKRNYVNIGLCFTNFSTDLILSVNQILKKNEINSHIADKGRRIYLYSEEAIERYMNIFDSSNSRVKDKYISWKDAKIAMQKV